MDLDISRIPAPYMESEEEERLLQDDCEYHSETSEVKPLDDHNCDHLLCMYYAF